MNYPKTISICHDNHFAMHTGKTLDGAQFFLTTPFIPADPNNRGSQFIALYLFDKDGTFMGAKIDDLGPRDSLDTDKADSIYEQFLKRLNKPTFCDIRIKPFQLERHGTTFGLIPSSQDKIQLVFEPGHYMAFSPPWDGAYQS